MRALPPAASQEIGADLLYVQEFWPTGMPRVRSLGDGLHELRSTASTGEYRLFFCVTHEAIVALHGFQKKTRTTPAGELQITRQRMKEVLEA